ncbi:MAG: hypothetical protein ACR2LK_14250 [Solirubrobacteraceae bacterium]
MAQQGAPQELASMPSTQGRPYAAYVVSLAIVAATAIALVSMLVYDTAEDALLVLGPSTAVISALVAAYLGVRSGSLAQQKSNELGAIQQSANQVKGE